MTTGHSLIFLELIQELEDQRTNITITKESSIARVPKEIIRVLRAMCQEQGQKDQIYVFSSDSHNTAEIKRSTLEMKWYLPYRPTQSS